ncbi:partial Oxygen regulatory protein NreC, partial [Anaerolineae bacterium]
LVQEHAPDVVLLDPVLETSQISGLDALREILGTSPITRVVILSAYSDERIVIPALAAGAAGYVLKNAHPDEVIEAVRDASKGQFHISPLITKKIVEHLTNVEGGFNHGSAEAKLTPREFEILPLISRGLSNQEIADHLTISPATVKTHVSNILHKLGLKDRNKISTWLAQHQALALS